MPLSLEWFWLSAHTEQCVFPYDQFIMIPEEDRRICLATELLREGPISRTVECDACQEGHVEEVVQMDYPDGKRRFFIPCPECFMVEVKPNRLRQWFPNYGVIAKLLCHSLNCRGMVEEILTGTLWNIGRAPLAGQSRSIWLARVINNEVKQNLPTGQQPILFIIFPQPVNVDGFDSDRIFQVNQLISIDKNGNLQFDIEAIQSQLKPFIKSPNLPRKAKRRETRATTIDTLKKAIRNEILSRKSALSQDWNANLPAPEQKYFADMLKVSTSSIHRALNDNDKELEWLWKILNDPRQIIKFNG